MSRRRALNSYWRCRVLQQLACGSTVAQAAADAGCTVRTLQREAHRVPEFCKLYHKYIAQNRFAFREHSQLASTASKQRYEKETND